MFPMTVHDWKIEPETEPWALKYKYGPLKAVNDGETLSGTLEEIMTQIVGQTEDYFYKAIEGYKKTVEAQQSLLSRMASHLQVAKNIHEGNRGAGTDFGNAIGALLQEYNSNK